MSDRRLFRDALVACLAAQDGLAVVGHAGTAADLDELCALRGAGGGAARRRRRLRGDAARCRHRPPRPHETRIVVVYEHLTPAELAALWRTGVDTLVPASHGLDALVVLIRRTAAGQGVAPAGGRRSGGADRPRAGDPAARRRRPHRLPRRRAAGDERRTRSRTPSAASTASSTWPATARPSAGPPRSASSTGCRYACRCTGRATGSAAGCPAWTGRARPAARRRGPAGPVDAVRDRTYAAGRPSHRRRGLAPRAGADRADRAGASRTGRRPRASTTRCVLVRGAGLDTVDLAERWAGASPPSCRPSGWPRTWCRHSRWRRTATSRSTRRTPGRCSPRCMPAAPSHEAGLPELTARESDILRSIAAGHTVRQTARSLGHRREDGGEHPGAAVPQARRAQPGGRAGPGARLGPDRDDRAGAATPTAGRRRRQRRPVGRTPTPPDGWPLTAGPPTPPAVDRNLAAPLSAERRRLSRPPLV